MSVFGRLLYFSCDLAPSVSPLLHAFSRFSRVKTTPSTSSGVVLLCSPLPHFSRFHQQRTLADSLSDPPTSDHSVQLDGEEEELVIPAPPTDCCMSGCSNCVWITYAKELVDIYKDGGKAAEKVMKVIDDPSLKIFLNLELKELLKESASEHSNDH